MRKKANGQTFLRDWQWVNNDLLLVHELCPFESLHQIVHEDENLELGVLFSRAHPWPSAEGHKGVGRRAIALKSRWIKFVGLWEVRMVFVC